MEEIFTKCKKLYLGSLDAARRGSSEGFFPPSFPFSTFPTTLTLSFTTAFPFSASISPSSDGFAAGAGFSRIPRPDDGQESEFEAVSFRSFSASRSSSAPVAHCLTRTSVARTIHDRHHSSSSNTCGPPPDKKHSGKTDGEDGDKSQSSHREPRNQVRQWNSGRCWEVFIEWGVRL